MNDQNAAHIDPLLSEFGETPIGLFIHEARLRRRTRMALVRLGFTDIRNHPAPPNYFNALSRLTSLLNGAEELFIFNLPPKPGLTYEKDNPAGIQQYLERVFDDLISRFDRKTNAPHRVFAKMAPLLEVEDVPPEALMPVTIKYRVPTVLLVSDEALIRKRLAGRDVDLAAQSFMTHFEELRGQLIHYFQDRDVLMTIAEDVLAENDLARRKARYQDLMAEALSHRAKGDVSAAINLLRQAIDVYPDDLTAHLQSGRLHAEQKAYARAASRLAQAETLFSDHPGPDVEMGHVCMMQVEDLHQSGSDSRDPKMRILLDKAADHFTKAFHKAVEMEPEFIYETGEEPEPVKTVSQAVKRWEADAWLSPDNPAVKRLSALAAGRPLEEAAAAPQASEKALTALAKGRQALEAGAIEQGVEYLFEAAKDPACLDDAYADLNQAGIRLRRLGRVDQALDLYNRLLSIIKTGQGPVLWNMAVACAKAGRPLHAAGYAAQALYASPELPLEGKFYDSLLPNLAPIFKDLVQNTLEMRKHRPNEPVKRLIKLHQARARLLVFLDAGRRADASRILVNLLTLDPEFCRQDEFAHDPRVQRLAARLADELAKSPKNADALAVVKAWRRDTAANPAKSAKTEFLILLRRAEEALSQDEKTAAVYFLGQALASAPPGYFRQPHFHARPSLAALGAEFAASLKYVDVPRVKAL